VWDHACLRWPPPRRTECVQCMVPGVIYNCISSGEMTLIIMLMIPSCTILDQHIMGLSLMRPPFLFLYFYRITCTVEATHPRPHPSFATVTAPKTMQLTSFALHCDVQPGHENQIRPSHRDGLPAIRLRTVRVALSLTMSSVIRFIHLIPDPLR
jgi:hypothetical protein